MVFTKVLYCIFYSQYKFGIGVLIVHRDGGQASKQSHWIREIIGQDMSYRQISGNSQPQGFKKQSTVGENVRAKNKSLHNLRNEQWTHIL